MKKLFLMFCISTAVIGAANAQTSDEFKKTEFFAGYSNSQHGGGARAATQHGINVSGVYNLARYFGVKADFSATFQNVERTWSVDYGLPPAIAYTERNSLYSFLGGVQVKDNAHGSRLKPFAHAMLGLGHRRIDVSNIRCVNDGPCIQIIPAVSTNSTGIAGAFGGGLDINIGERIQFRLVQVDYNPVRVFGRT